MIIKTYTYEVNKEEPMDYQNATYELDHKAREYQKGHAVSYQTACTQVLNSDDDLKRRYLYGDKATEEPNASFEVNDRALKVQAERGVPYKEALRTVMHEIYNQARQETKKHGVAVASALTRVTNLMSGVRLEDGPPASSRPTSSLSPEYAALVSGLPASAGRQRS